jgi:hypothetical protein
MQQLQGRAAALRVLDRSRGTEGGDAQNPFTRFEARVWSPDADQVLADHELVFKKYIAQLNMKRITPPLSRTMIFCGHT